MSNSAYRDLVALAERAASGELEAARFRRPSSNLGADSKDGLSSGESSDGSTTAAPPVFPSAAKRAPRTAAVLLLFGALDDVPAASSLPLVSRDLDVLLVERAATLNDHPGQVAFPGGGVELADDSLSAAALREAVEETGVDPSGVRILGELPSGPLTVSNFIVTPVLAWWEKQTPVDVVDFGESARVFRVPVRDLLDPVNRVTATLTRGGVTYKSPAFVVDGVVVWGFTAGILDHVFQELGWSVPWDATREIPAPL